jgi:hypothetical protein
MHPDEEDAFTLFVGKSHVEPKQTGRLNGIAPMGYGMAIIGKNVNLRHWGFGGEKNTEAMLAHGLVRGADIVFIECHTPTIHIIAPKIGTQMYLTEFVPKWLKELSEGRPGFTRDNLKTWRSLYDLSGLGTLVMRMPETDEEAQLSKAVQTMARAAAEHAFLEFGRNKARFENAGVIVTDDDTESHMVVLGEAVRQRRGGPEAQVAKQARTRKP